MCLAADCPRRQTQGDDFFSLMTQRLAHEGGLVPEATVWKRWRGQGRLSADFLNDLNGGRLHSIWCASQRWLPAFQFQADGCTPREDVAIVARELAGAMDGAEILAWFACSNTSLDDETPIARLRTDLATVLEAARLDRFICSD